MALEGDISAPEKVCWEGDGIMYRPKWSVF